ncbi:MAG: RcnB family protein [Pseudomonadota bacterium]|nr:RcnB family protein [Pseudomonadota bacterium]
MKTTALVCAIAAAALSFSSLSFAQDYERRGPDSQAQRNDARNPMARDGRHGGADQREERYQQRGRDGHDAGSRAFEQHGNRNDHRGFDQRDGRNDHRGFDQRNSRNDHRGFDQHDARNDRQFGARGAQFHRGGRIPTEYRHRQYVVNDWRPHHLSAPPRGQQWVQVGADYALIVIATGIIAQLVLSN